MHRNEDKVWRVESSRTVLKDRWIDVRADDCVRADGVRIAPYYVLSYPEWVHIVCLDANERICLVDQYRHAAGVVVRELPGGMLEPGRRRWKALSANWRKKQASPRRIGDSSARTLPIRPRTQTGFISSPARRWEKAAVSRKTRRRTCTLTSPAWRKSKGISRTARSCSSAT